VRYRVPRARTHSGTSAAWRELRARRYRRSYARDKARERLGEQLYKKLRRNTIRANRSWEDSQTVFNAAMARLFYIARCEIVAGLAGPYPLTTV
jgi:hypothetical protein